MKDWIGLGTHLAAYMIGSMHAYCFAAGELPGWAGWAAGGLVAVLNLANRRWTA